MWKSPLPVPAISIAPSAESAFAVKLSGYFPVFAGERARRDRLPVVFARPPDQRDLHLAAGRAAKIDPPCVLFTLHQGQARLPDSVRRGGVEFDARALVAHKRLVLVHRHHFVGTDRLPSAKPHTEGTALPSRVFRLLGRDREVELPVVEHLGPQAAVHRAADVLDEHAVLVLRHRRRRLLRVNGCDQLFRAGRLGLLRRQRRRTHCKQCRRPQECAPYLHMVSPFMALPFARRRIPAPRRSLRLGSVGELPNGMSIRFPAARINRFSRSRCISLFCLLASFACYPCGFVCRNAESGFLIRHRGNGNPARRGCRGDPGASGKIESTL